MNKPQWTNEQSAAITRRGELLVAAAAGSGKTAVLVERLIQQITDSNHPVDVDRFLVVTFTKAAANEMRERIGKALDEALFRENDPREIDRLLSQRTLLQRASITTLHSFCLELIRKHFYRLELDPGFRVADQAEADLMAQDVVEELFEARYQKEDGDFLQLVEAFGTDRDDQPLMNYVLTLYTFAYSQSRPQVWLSALSDPYRWESPEAFMQSQWGQAVRQGLLDLAVESQHLLQRAAAMTQVPGGPLNYGPVLQDDLKRVGLLCQAIQAGTWSELAAQFQAAVNFSRLPAIRSKSKAKSGAGAELAEADEALAKQRQEECKELRDEAKKKLNSLKEAVFAYPLEDQLPAFRELALLAQALGGLVSEFAHKYTIAKGLRNILDFTDLEHYALKLLEEEGEPSPIAQGLKAYFREVLVDEYQDINPVQERILHLVSRQEESPNLFMVGDVKQSIYRFRMADPGLFIAKYKDLPHWHAQLSQDVNKLVIDLNRNFRSRREVIEGVNFLFRQIMTLSCGEIAYDSQAALQYGASYLTGESPVPLAEGPIEVHLIDSKSIKNKLSSYSDEGQEEGVNRTAGEEEGDNDSSREGREGQGNTQGEAGGIEEELSPEDLNSIRIEARFVAERIRQIIDGEEFQVIDKISREFRPVRCSDIVILMRSYAAGAPIYVEEFQAAAIPVYAETSSGYFGASEVETMLSLLKIIDNPHLDIPLAAVLRSPFVGLNGRELGKIRMTLPEGDFYEALTLAVWAGPRQEALASEYGAEIQGILGLYEESLLRRCERARLLLEDAPGLAEKLTDFWLKLQTWRTRSRRTSLAELIWSLYEDTGYLAYVGTLPAGVQRQANLRVLYDRARRFEATRYRGLFRFLRFLDRFQGQGKDMGSARALGENEDVVRLISVHASKGLEFPFVFFVGLGRRFNTQSLRGRMLLHSKLGIGMPVMDIEHKVRYPSLIQYAVRQTLAQEALAEEMRILYVALTRAKERLFLYGVSDNLETTLQRWQRTAEWQEEALPDGQLKNAKCFLDWIGPALVRHPGRLFGQAGCGEGGIIPQSDSESSRWEILFHDSLTPLKEESAAPDTVTAVDNEPENNTRAEQWDAEVARRLNWQYPHLAAVGQAAKTSVSELKRQSPWYAGQEASALSSFGNSQEIAPRPKFLQAAQPLTAAERGTALHTVMQHLSFKELAPLWTTWSGQEKTAYLGKVFNKLEEEEILTPEQKSSLRTEQIVHFLGTSVAERLFKAAEILREVPFTLTLPMEGHHKILVQGVIDVVMIDKDEQGHIKAEILDYKTDSLSRGGEMNPEEILRERYALQLALYALAIQRLTKAEVSRCTLYAFTLGREIEIPEQLRRDILSSGLPSW